MLNLCPLQAAVQDGYFQDFDSIADGVSIQGKDNWNVFSGAAGNAIIQSNVTSSGSGKSLGLIGALIVPQVERPFLYGGLTPTWIRFKVRPSVSGQTPDVPIGGIGAVCFDYTGKVLAAEGASWVDTGATYSIGSWYTVAMKVDFKNHTYDLYVGSSDVFDPELVLVRSSLNFIDSSINSLNDIKFSGSYSTSGSSIAYLDDISVSYIERLTITTASPRLMQGQVSGPIIVELQDDESFAQTAMADITLLLRSTSGQGRFSLSRDPWVDVEQVVLPRFAQNAIFYYKDTIAGKPLISVSEYPDQGYNDALQEIEVANKVSRFDIEVFSPQVAGQNFDMIVTAKNKEGDTEEAYGGTVILSVNYVSPSSGGFTVIPDNVSGFVRGVLHAGVEYPDCGLVTITATDSEDSSQSGTSSSILFLPAGFTLSAETPQIVSKPFTLTLNAKNLQGEPTPNYNGSVCIYPEAVVPDNVSKAELRPVKISGADFLNGSASTEVSYNLCGKIRIKAEDSADRRSSGVSNELEFLPKRLGISVTPAPGGRDFFYISEPVLLVVTVEDALGNPIPNYYGTVELISSVGLSVPNPHVFTGADSGKFTFLVVPEQEGVYTVVVRARDIGLSAESLKINVKNAIIQVVDATAPIGTGEVVIQIVDDEGHLITSESSLTVNVEAVEDIDNDSVSLFSNSATFNNGKITIPVTDTEAETVIITVSSVYRIKIKKGSIVFGRLGKTGINQLMWRELKNKK